MKYAEAPLYVQALDLYLWTAKHCCKLTDGPATLVTGRLNRRLLDLTEEIAIAVEFKSRRLERLSEIDRSLRRLKTLFTLLNRFDALTGDQLEFAWGKLGDLGKMVGGWVRREVALDQSRCTRENRHGAP